jgi:hypothetical protein
VSVVEDFTTLGDEDCRMSFVCRPSISSYGRGEADAPKAVDRRQKQSNRIKRITGQGCLSSMKNATPVKARVLIGMMSLKGSTKYGRQSRGWFDNDALPITFSSRRQE